jgi:hypothetical protein
MLGRLVQLRFEGVPEDAEVSIDTVRGLESIGEVNGSWRGEPAKLIVVVMSREVVDNLRAGVAR